MASTFKSTYIHTYIRTKEIISDTRVVVVRQREVGDILFHLLRPWQRRSVTEFKLSTPSTIDSFFLPGKALSDGKYLFQQYMKAKSKFAGRNRINLENPAFWPLQLIGY